MPQLSMKNPGSLLTLAVHGNWTLLATPEFKIMRIFAVIFVFLGLGNLALCTGSRMIPAIIGYSNALVVITGRDYEWWPSNAQIDDNNTS